MGLDQYLYAEKCVSGYEFSAPAERDSYNAIVKMMGLESVITSESASAEVKVTVAYWRKANAIHNWFVQQAQDGTDECQLTYVERELLEVLRNLCKEVIGLYDAGNKEGAAKLLPPSTGFFFGSTEVDDDYREDLRNTIEQLDRVLSIEEEVNFYYQSSW